MYVSDKYRELISQLHSEREEWGSKSNKYSKRTIKLASRYNCSSVLDYGCGKGNLKKGVLLTFEENKSPMNFEMFEYDPGIPGKDSPPNPCDLIMCTDVIEHIEPELLDNVLDHFLQLTKKIAFIAISTRPAKERLPDGRDAHLIIEPVEWWLSKFKEKFEIVDYGVKNDKQCWVMITTKEYSATKEYYIINKSK